MHAQLSASLAENGCTLARPAGKTAVHPSTLADPPASIADPERTAADASADVAGAGSIAAASTDRLAIPGGDT
jgi:hypothetical protein